MHFVVSSPLLSFISPHFFEIWNKQAIRLFFFPKEAPPPFSTANICLHPHFSGPPFTLQKRGSSFFLNCSGGAIICPQYSFLFLSALLFFHRSVGGGKDRKVEGGGRKKQFPPMFLLQDEQEEAELVKSVFRPVSQPFAFQEGGT